MLKTVLRRMFSNPWLIICLLVGSIMATALVSCIPIYTDGILQRMLTKDMENYQLEKGYYPGLYSVKATFIYSKNYKERAATQRYFSEEIMTKRLPELDVPILSATEHISMANLSIPLEEQEKYDYKSKMMAAKLGAISGLEDHITIVNGRMCSDEITDGVIEVIVSQQTMVTQELVLDKVYTLLDAKKSYNELCKVKVVGVFTVKDSDDPYWIHGLSDHNKELMMDYDLFTNEFLINNPGPITDSEWTCALDYHKITLQNLSHIEDIYGKHTEWYAKYRSNVEFRMPINSILTEYKERAKQLSNMLLVLTVPVLIMLTFYIYMVSQLVVNHDENEIAVLKSRGASKIQIFISYLAESLIIAGIAFLTGPVFGLFICKILGASNGFLEFVQRTALPVSLNRKVYGYSLFAVLFLVITMLVPVISVSRKSIVNYKQEKARAKKTALWKKFFLDFILLGVAGYGIYRYQQQQEILRTTGVSANELKIDPLLFLTSTIFVLGAGLLFIRLYPYLIRFIHWIGKKFWTPVMYISLIQVGRSGGQEQFLMLFLVLAISTGLFSANAARTVNRNMEDKIRYSIGSDVRLKAVWKTNQSSMPENVQQATGQQKMEPLRYYEPNFNDYATLSGTELATKVLNVEEGTLQTSTQWINSIRIMGIIPDEFAKVAWFRTDLLPHHWYEYLNLMADAPTAMLVSSNLKDEYNLEVGDSVYISWDDQNFLEGRIYAFIDYWPTFNPNAEAGPFKNPGLVVANLSYIQSKMALQPYEVWIKKQDGATDKQINDDITAKGLELESIEYSGQEIVKMKNDAMLQGMNGMLSLGFIASMLISLLGFLIYWIISIQNRTLQFGILRAIGMSLARVIGMLACEQLLVSGAAIIVGIIIGGITGDLFIPLLQIMYSSADQVPPFRIVAYGSDYIKVYTVIALMVTIGFLILWRIISKIRIDQAVKLGED